MKHDLNHIRNAIYDFNRRLALGAYDVYLRYLFLILATTLIGSAIWKMFY